MFLELSRLFRLATLVAGISVYGLLASQAAVGQTVPPSAQQAQPQSAPAPQATPHQAPEATAQPALEQPAATEAPAAQHAQPAPPPSAIFPEELAKQVPQLATAIENAEKAVERVKERESGLAEQRIEAERIETKAIEVAAALRDPISAVRAQLEKLGPAPQDKAVEAANVAAERARLSAALTEMEGAVKTAELTQVRARQLIGRVQHLRQAHFTRDVLRHSPTLLTKTAWQQLIHEVPRAARQFNRIAIGWWNDARLYVLEILGLLAVGAAAYLVIYRFLSRLVSRRQHYSGKPSPFFRRTRSAGVRFLAHALPATTAAAIVYLGLVWLDLLTFPFGTLVETLLIAVLLYAAISSFAAAILIPCPPDHRLLAIPESSAPKLYSLANGFAALFAVDYALTGISRILFLPFEIGVAQASVSSLVFALLLAAFVATPLVAQRPDAPKPDALAPVWLKLPLIILATAIVITTLLGFVSLGRFIAAQVTLVGAAVILLLLAHLSFRSVAEQIAGSDRGLLIENRFGLDQERTSYLSKLLVGLFDTALIFATVPILLLTWGFAKDDILDWLKLGMFGFEIGQFRISLVRILLAVGLFVGVVALTRIVQRWLDQSILRPARVDSAISHSVLLGIGYAGIGIAGVAALSYAGLDFTHLAIVAGALSVGIGFGLQAIFNNFVSGIILLVERPVKVGDWIIVNGREGFVRRINVRATEIETFDRASVIVPNSQLITGEVVNLTHRNAMGRVLIKVEASYKADPEQVIAILRAVAEKSPSILKLPAPGVVFDDFGASGMAFSLTAFMADVSQRGRVQTELRVAINKAFREAGIEIPYPQQDIHLRDLDGVRSALSAAMEARRREKEKDLTEKDLEASG